MVRGNVHLEGAERRDVAMFWGLEMSCVLEKVPTESGVCLCEWNGGCWIEAESVLGR